MRVSKIVMIMFCKKIKKAYEVICQRSFAFMFYVAPIVPAVPLCEYSTAQDRSMFLHHCDNYGVRRHRLNLGYQRRIRLCSGVLIHEIFEAIFYYLWRKLPLSTVVMVGVQIKPFAFRSFFYVTAMQLSISVGQRLDS